MTKNPHNTLTVSCQQPLPRINNATTYQSNLCTQPRHQCRSRDHTNLCYANNMKSSWLSRLVSEAICTSPISNYSMPSCQLDQRNFTMMFSATSLTDCCYMILQNHNACNGLFYFPVLGPSETFPLSRARMTTELCRAESLQYLDPNPTQHGDISYKHLLSLGGSRTHLT